MRKQANDDLDIEYVRSRLSYDRDAGKLIWKSVPDDGTFHARYINGRLAGKDAGGKNDLGYILIRFSNRRYKAHRLIWAMETGSYPTKDIDHIDGNTSNNRFENLRQATALENSHNTRVFVNNKCGVKGVHWNADTQKWRAQIRLKHTHLHLGLFKTLEEAGEAYQRAAREHYGEFVRG